MSSVKISVNLPEASVKALRDIAKRDHVTMTEALRRSISLQQFVEEAQNDDGTILVEKKDGSVQRLVIR